MTSPREPQERALAEFRSQHPDMGDLPDEAVVKLLPVQLLALNIAVRDLGSEIKKSLPQLVAFLAAVWVIVLAVVLFTR